MCVPNWKYRLPKSFNHVNQSFTFVLLQCLIAFLFRVSARTTIQLDMEIWLNFSFISSYLGLYTTTYHRAQYFVFALFLARVKSETFPLHHNSRAVSISSGGHYLEVLLTLVVNTVLILKWLQGVLHHETLSVDAIECETHASSFSTESFPIISSFSFSLQLFVLLLHASRFNSITRR